MFPPPDRLAQPDRPTAESIRNRLRAHVTDLLGEDDPEFIADLSETFTETATALLADARAAEAAGNVAAVAAAAHQLCGSASNIGLTTLAEAWRRVETAGGGAAAATLFAEAATQTEHAVEALAGA